MVRNFWRRWPAKFSLATLWGMAFLGEASALIAQSRPPSSPGTYRTVSSSQVFSGYDSFDSLGNTGNGCRSCQSGTGLSRPGYSSIPGGSCYQDYRSFSQPAIGGQPWIGNPNSSFSPFDPRGTGDALAPVADPLMITPYGNSRAMTAVPPISGGSRYTNTPLYGGSPSPLPVPMQSGPVSSPAVPEADPGRTGNCQLYTAYTSMGYYGGTTPSTGVASLFVPLMQSQTEMVYADVRGLFNDREAYQGSFGAGFRSLVADSLILGTYGFYDFRTSELRHQFNQAVAGVEMLTLNWEARANGYIPTHGGGSGGIAPGTGTAVIQNGSVFILGQQQVALSGVDGELGALIAADPLRSTELRAFAGGYHFNAQGGGRDLAGVMGRLEARIYDLPWLGNGSRVECGLITTYDDVRRAQFTGMVNVRLALGQPTCQRGLTFLERRMLDRVVRLNDVVTTNSASSSEPAINNLTGAQFSSVVLVQPGDDLQAKVAAASPNSLIVVEGGGGTFSTPAGILLQPGQTLAGGGTTLAVSGANSHQSATLLLPGSRPHIDRPNTLGAVVTLAGGNTVTGVDITGGDNGILGDHVNYTTISDVSVSNNSFQGIRMLDLDDVTLKNVHVFQTGDIGIYFQNVNDSSIKGVTIDNTAGSAMYLNCGMNLTLDGLTIDATNVGADAFKLHTQTNANISNVNISHTLFNGLTIGSSTVVNFSHVTIDTFGQDGLQAIQSGTFTFNDMKFLNGGNNGLVIDDTDLVSLNNSTFNTVTNAVEFLNLPNNMSGSGNTAFNFTTLSTGTTGGGSFLFSTPNASAP